MDATNQPGDAPPSLRRALLPVEIVYSFTLQANGREYVCVRHSNRTDAFIVAADVLVEVGSQ